MIQKGAQDKWTGEYEVVFETSKSKLLAPLVLTYPDFSKDFVLDTDASKHGVGAILSQCQEDNRLHPYPEAVSQPQLLKLTTLLPTWRYQL